MPQDLIQLALFNNDPDLLSYLLGLGDDFNDQTAGDPEEDLSKTKSFSIAHNTFLYAIKANRPHLLAELIKRTGAGIPLNKFAKASGVEVTQKPKYYQGLSVHGRKRKDWADAGHNVVVHEPMEYHRPPLLEAAHYGVLDTTEWLAGDAPLRSYRQFAQAHSDDKRLQMLARSKRSFEASVKKFLGTRSQLALHGAVVAEPTVESLELIQYLVESMPDSLEAKNVDGLTPLLVAFKLYRHDAAKLLLEAGADQTVRAKNGMNLVHLVLEGASIDYEKQHNQLKAMLSLIDERLLPDMFIERCSLDPGSLTPLALWIRSTSFYGSNKNWEKMVLSLILSTSNGRELSLLNGEGDTPLHVMMRTSKFWLVEVVLEAAPQLVNRENAVGTTSYEMAEDQEIASICMYPPTVKYNSPGYRLRGMVGTSYGSITVAQPQYFIDKKVGSEEEDTSKEKTCWQLAQQARARLEAEGKDQRRLVTLGEANVVAERVAQAKSSRSRHQWSAGKAVDSDEDAEEDKEDEEEENELSDEVSGWVAGASRWAGVWFVGED